MIVTVDSDSVVAADTLRQLNSPFIDSKIGGVAGDIRVLNIQDGILPRMMDVNFVFGFEIMRSAQSVLRSVFCTPGALSAYRRTAMLPFLDEWVEQKFFGEPAHIAEDRALATYLMSEGHRIVFQRDAIAHTMIPTDYRTTCKMLMRWGRGDVRETCSMYRFAFRKLDWFHLGIQFNLLMQRSCLKNICFPMELAGVKKADAEKRARELLEMVGLPDKANAYPAQLSGGQKQRIAIARALATNPKVLLCDEATSALDPNTTHAILTLIKDINKKLGITVVVITHQMSVVEEICDSVAILDGGVVVEQGEVREIFANPKTAAARRLVAPNGGSAARDLSSFAPDDHVVRVTFNGSSAAKPLVASLAAEKGILVSVLSADTRDLSGQCYGSMLLKLPRDTEQAKQAAAYMRSQNGVTVEEVTGE